MRGTPETAHEATFGRVASAAGFAPGGGRDRSRFLGVGSMTSIMRSSPDLGKQLDSQLRSAGLPDLMKGHGFQAKRSPRRWARDLDGCRQLAAVYVDGRSAPDGYLIARLEAGIRFAGEREIFEVSGEGVCWSLDPSPDPLQHWRFDAQAIERGDVGREIVTHMTSYALPLLDRLIDQRAARDYYVDENIDLMAIIELSRAIGDADTARAAARREVARFANALQTTSPPSVYSVRHMLKIVSELELEITAEERATLEQGTKLV